MGSNKAKRTRILEELLDAAELLTELRRELRVFYTKTLGWGRHHGQSDSDKRYFAGMRKCAEELKQIVEKRHKPEWRRQWAERRRERQAEIARIQRRPAGPVIHLIPPPESEADLEQEAASVQATDELAKLDEKRKRLLRQLKEQDQSTEEGYRCAARIVSQLEQLDTRHTELTIAVWQGVVERMRAGIERMPKGDVKAIPHIEFLALIRMENGKIAAYRVSATSEAVGCQHLERETHGVSIATYKDWREAARFGLDVAAAPRFTVTEYTSGDVRCEFDVDRS